MGFYYQLIWRMVSIEFRKQLHRPVVIALLLIVVSSPLLVPVHSARAAGEVYDKEFVWSYGGYRWSFNMSIPKELYEAYREVSVMQRVLSRTSGYGLLTTTKDPFLVQLTDELNRTAAEEGYSHYETVSFVLAFVQSLPYTSDSSTQAYDEYPRFPIETLVDGGGDCEDTSFLFATVMSILGYDVIYISPPRHLAVGILGSSDIPGIYWTYNDKRYYYCETTGDNFQIGELPTEFEGQKARLFPIDLSKQYIPKVSATPAPHPTPLYPEPTLTTQQPKPTFAGPSDLTSTPSLTFNQKLTSTGRASITQILSAYWLPLLGLLTVLVGIIMLYFSRKPTKTPQTIPAPPTPDHTDPPFKFCIFCGAKNKPIATYCKQCGQKIE